MNARKKIKHWLGKALATTGLHRALLGNRGLIVLFHRVDPRLPDNPISCTDAEFDRWCAFFAKHFDVVSLSDMHAASASPSPLAGKLAITFDDGYRDNAEHAAPILKRHGLPACFFIATNFIGSNHRPWWDDDLPFHPEWMDWDQVRALQAEGFEIGGHTMNHVDMGRVPGDECEEEVRGSLSKLAHELPDPVVHFSFPYGGRANINATNRNIVKAAGCQTLSAAHSGFVSNATDPFDIERVPISPWFESPYQFLFEMVLARFGRGGEPPVLAAPPEPAEA